ncbi:Protein F01F1.3 [Aphelenchoides avenae]|nr:Protein F01F1.3 [Aphelenchus avenae]
MHEDQLRNVLSSLAHLATIDGDIPVPAFGTLISTANGELIAEHLHQRWLADESFAPIAARILLHLHGPENRDMALCSRILSLVLHDFRKRLEIRRSSRRMFQNATRAIAELYPAFRKIDKSVSNFFVDPLFSSLNILIDDDPQDTDIRCAARIAVDWGHILSELRPSETDELITKMRRTLCSSTVSLDEATKLSLMRAIDLWTFAWDWSLLPKCVKEFHKPGSTGSVIVEQPGEEPPALVTDAFIHPTRKDPITVQRSFSYSSMVHEVQEVRSVSPSELESQV